MSFVTAPTLAAASWHVRLLPSLLVKGNTNCVSVREVK